MSERKIVTAEIACWKCGGTSLIGITVSAFDPGIVDPVRIYVSLRCGRCHTLIKDHYVDLKDKVIS